MGAGLGALKARLNMGKFFASTERLLKAHKVGCTVCNAGHVCAFARGVSTAQRAAVLGEVFGVDSKPVKV